MKLILLSGGAGKRLWPLSNDARSKQFLKLIHNAHGEPESMVQRVWRQLAAYQWSNEAYISTSRSHMDLLQSQLGEDVPLIIEPDKRDTFPAIALAATYLHSCVGVEPDEVVIVMPVDSYVETSFWGKLNELESALLQSEADLALIGVAPTYASTKYGYIVPKQKPEGNKSPAFYHQVASFKEKPDQNQAEALLKKQALWNCGIFSFRLGYLLDVLKSKGIPTSYDQLLQNYLALQPISFDYEVVEKAKKVVVVPYQGYWKDLGTWNTLTEEMNVHSVGRVVWDEESSNTHVINELDIPIVSIGLSDMVIAASLDGILIASKEKSHRIKEMPVDWKQRPMVEEKRWGYYRVLHYRTTEEGTEVLTKALHVYANKNLSYQLHQQRSEVWTIVAGEGEFVLNDRIIRIGPGDVLEIPVGAKHAVRASKDLEIIEVQLGSKLIEEDIVRLAMTWEEIMEQVRAGDEEHDQ
ncbi:MULTISPECIES: sugar phosphate nucleotidyltransferase [Brevibacillus]|uniref:sugar phosphate nucleotidyltransferase n=1 Tax=Brevibacillus TaxID=55080 RepID=UPI00203EC358|nr:MULTISPECIES: sugar phosphate nucleotidyltransferase [Brevibacillus]MCM3078127.1 sugar phosphate nucleotidyltransferase [Brevibacillus invocatus]MCM3428287.1 sugar phosphate nucleotidyltransferase [Brevibacillus invocatus]MDH4617597.1 cupin domain-containing protein [Brevibacillus sp. AY1]